MWWIQHQHEQSVRILLAVRPERFQVVRGFDESRSGLLCVGTLVAASGQRREAARVARERLLLARDRSAHLLEPLDAPECRRVEHRVRRRGGVRVVTAELHVHVQLSAYRVSRVAKGARGAATERASDRYRASGTRQRARLVGLWHEWRALRSVLPAPNTINSQITYY